MVTESCSLKILRKEIHARNGVVYTFHVSHAIMTVVSTLIISHLHADSGLLVAFKGTRLYTANQQLATIE